MSLWTRIKAIVKKQKTLKSAPLIIIQKDSNSSEVKEYSSIEKAIADLEKDAGIPKEKLEHLKKSLDTLKHKDSVRIRNGEIIE